MIKVPATTAGYEAMEALTADSIPVNATLVFKKEQAVACAEAFQRGLAKAEKKVDTVISIFVSRIDRALDPLLVEKGIAPALTGIYNSSVIYEAIEALKVERCRALFASTGVKDDSLPPYYYVEKLLAYRSVNTAPVATIKSFVQEASITKALPIENELVKKHFALLEKAGIDLDALLDQQIEEGLVAFKEAFKDILERL